MNDFDHSAFSETIEDRYFDRLKDKFQLQFYLFDSEKNTRYDPSNFDLKEFARFQEIINASGEQCEDAKNLFFIMIIPTS